MIESDHQRKLRLESTGNRMNVATCTSSEKTLRRLDRDVRKIKKTEREMC